MIFSKMRGRILRSFWADSIGQFINLFSRLAVAPLFISSWGAQAYGEWLILTAVATIYFGIGDLGGQLFFVNRMTIDWSLRRLDLFQRTLSTGVFLFIGSSCILFILIYIALSFLPINLWLSLKIVNHELAVTILLIMALRFLISLPVGIFLGVYRAIGFQATSVMYGNLILILQFFFSMFLLLMGEGMVMLAFSEIVPFLIVFIIVIFDLRRRLPIEIGLFKISCFDKALFRDSISPSLHFLSLQLSMAMIAQGAVIIVANTLGPVQVAVLSSMRIVANSMSRFIGIITHAVWPEVTRLVSLDQVGLLTKLFNQILQISLAIGIFYILCISSFGEFLYKWWLNNKLPYNHLVMYLLSSQVMFNSFWTWGGVVLMASNQHEEYSRFQLTINFFALLFSYLGCLKYGLVGAVAGLIIVQSFLMLLLIVWVFNKKSWSLMSRDLLVTSLIGLLIILFELNIWFGIVGILAFLFRQRALISSLFIKIFTELQ